MGSPLCRARLDLRAPGLQIGGRTGLAVLPVSALEPPAFDRAVEGDKIGGESELQEKADFIACLHEAAALRQSDSHFAGR